MFGSTYFAPTHFAPTYFGPAAGETVSVRGSGFYGYSQARIVKRIKEEIEKRRKDEITEIKEDVIQVEVLAKAEIEDITELLVKEVSEEAGVYQEELEIRLRMMIEQLIQQILEEEAIFIMMHLL